MKKTKNYIHAAVTAMALFVAAPAGAQYMPVVFDNTFGREHEFVLMNADFGNGDIVLAGTDKTHATLTWVSEYGSVRQFKTFDGSDLSEITAIVPLSDDKALITGYILPSNNSGAEATGRAMVISQDGFVERDLYIGSAGTRVLNGMMLPDGSIILSGATPRGNSESGFVCKISPEDNNIFFYTAPTGTECRHFDVHGAHSEFLHAAFSSDGEGSCVVRLDRNGKPYYVTTLPDETYVVEKMLSTAEGYAYLVGHGANVGGTIIKVRPEGDVIYDKVIVPAGEDTRVSHLAILPSEDLLVGGHGAGKAYYAVLRADGTSLLSGVDRGVVLAVAQNILGNHFVMSLYDESTSIGKIIKLSKSGRRLYEKSTAAPFTVLRVNGDENLLMAAPSSGRLSMLSETGELLFDRYARENKPTTYYGACLPYSGEAFFVGPRSNIVKLAHGVYVNDITVNKPIEGSTIATFTVILTGYGFNADGTPRPVTVRYRTDQKSAKETLNFTPSNGTLSFIPNSDGSDRYLGKFTVEVPVLANDLLEGNRTFDLYLTDASGSYIIGDRAVATIIDQPAVARMINTTPGREGESNVSFELGLFKTNGVKLTNATRSDIVIEGVYGRGTADAQDFDWGRQPRLFIHSGAHSGTFEVYTLEDTRYENVKTVVVDFNQIDAMSDTEISFGGSTVLSCEGKIFDQPAMVAIESLGDFNRQNNVVSPFFKISLLRAKDGALQTNCSGGDITFSTKLEASTTARKGTDFVFTNEYDLRIRADERSSTSNLNGIVLYTPDGGDTQVTVALSGVVSTEGSGALTISEEQQVASFNINR